MAESIQRGDIRENSFGMFVTDDVWEERDGMMRRSVRVAQLMEVGPQPFPAYPQSDVSVRSLRDVLAHGKRCIGKACPRGGQDPDVLLRELELSRRGVGKKGGNDPDLLLRELDSRPQPKAAEPIPSEATYRRLLANDRRRIRAVCTHEAGHAVANVLNGNGVKGVRLRWRSSPGASFEGWSWSFTGGECVHRTGESTPLTLMAGRAAEELAGCDTLPSDWGEGDRRKARRLSKRWITEDLTAATALLRRHWPAVRALARRLMQVQVIDGDEAEAIILAKLDIATRSRLRTAA